MVRIRIGQSWKTNPDYVARLRALAEGKGRGFSPRRLVDTVGFELDGVDLAQGLGQVALLDALTGLARAARVLAAGPGAERLAFAGAPVEVRLARTGDELRLTLVVRDRDALVVRDAVVEPARFLAAVRRAVDELAADLAAIHPGLGELKVVRRLVTAAESLPRRVASRGGVRQVPPVETLVPLGRARLGLTFGGTSLAVLSADTGQSVWLAAGAPRRTLALLGRAALGEPPAEALRQVELLPGGRGLRFGRKIACSFEELRRAVRALGAGAGRWAGSGEEELAAVLARLGDGGPPGMPVRVAPPERTRPARPRVAAEGLRTEGLRRLVLRHAWRLDAPGIRPRLARLERDLLIATRRRVERRGPDGALAWSAPVGGAVPWVRASGEVVVGRDARGGIVVLDPAGRRLMRVVPPGALRAPELVPAGEARVVLAGREGIGSLAPAGGASWLFEAAEDGRLRVVADDAIVLVGQEGGLLHGLAADTGRGWRTATGLAQLDWLGLDRQRGLALVAGADPHGEAAVAGLALADGRPLWFARCEGGVRVTPPIVMGERLVVGCEALSGPRVSAFDLTTRRWAWEHAVPDDGRPLMIAAGSRILVPRCGGGLVAFSQTGRLVFRTPPGDPEPALSPQKPRPAALGAGLVVLLGACVQVVDVARGRPVALLEPAELAPSHALILDGPTIVVAPEDGSLVEAWQATGHLRVLPGLEGGAGPGENVRSRTGAPAGRR